MFRCFDCETLFEPDTRQPLQICPHCNFGHNVVGNGIGPVYGCVYCHMVFFESHGAEHSVGCDGKIKKLWDGWKSVPPKPPATHDPHYKAMEIEPFQVMEQRIRPYMGEDQYGPHQTAKLAMAVAIKHIMRAGLKKGQPWEKDIEKAINYLTRALTGEWLDDRGGNSQNPTNQ